MFKRLTLQEKSRVMYDWANSAYSAIISASVLPIFFKSMSKAAGVESHMATVYGDSVGISSTILLVGIAIYIVICIVGYRMTTPLEFWIPAILVATSQRGIQALSRSYFSKMIPKEFLFSFPRG
jgi:MFS-type transporter involved in bile tolerance (Atg22 family)